MFTQHMCRRRARGAIITTATSGDTLINLHLLMRNGEHPHPFQWTYHHTGEYV